MYKFNKVDCGMCMVCVVDEVGCKVIGLRYFEILFAYVKESIEV